MKFFKINIADPELMLNVLMILTVSYVTLSSVVAGRFLFKQMAFSLIAFVIVYVSYKIFDLSFYFRYSLLIYFLNIALLLALKFFGHTVMGSQRWLKLGPLSLQPSELAKVALIIFLAAWLSKRPIKSYWDIFQTLALVSVPAALVLIQPDLGTTLVYIAISFGMLFWAGAKIIELLILVSPLVTAILSSFGYKLMEYHNGRIDFALTVPALVFLVFLFVAVTIYYKAWTSPWLSSGVFALLSFNAVVVVFRTIAWGLLREYQQKRLTIFLDPYVDPLGAGYHIIQSLYAIGSGGFIGQGLKNGDLTQGQFVPEQHTDFIFSGLGEEFGFIGTFLLLALFAWLCINIINRARFVKDRFVSLLAIGIFSMFIFHIFINVGMNLSLMPITGVPLPFMSYGGSALLVDMFLISLIIKGVNLKSRIS